MFVKGGLIDKTIARRGLNTAFKGALLNCRQEGEGRPTRKPDDLAIDFHISGTLGELSKELLTAATARFDAFLFQSQRSSRVCLLHSYAAKCGRLRRLLKRNLRFTTLHITIFHKILPAYLIIHSGSLKIICWYALRHMGASSFEKWRQGRNCWGCGLKSPSEPVFQHIWGPYYCTSIVSSWLMWRTVRSCDDSSDMERVDALHLSIHRLRAYIGCCRIYGA